MKQRIFGSLILAAFLALLAYDLWNTESGRPQHQRLYNFNNG